MVKRTWNSAACLGLLLAACSGQPVSPSVPAELPESSRLTSSAPKTTESTSSPSATSTPMPPLATPAGGGTHFAPASIVEVVVDGLAVRGGPGTAYPLLGAERHSEDGAVPLGTPYRLSAGERLHIEAGPLQIDGMAWYKVRYSDEVMWVSPDGAAPQPEGWVAAGEQGDAYLELSAVPDEFCCYYASGVGSGVTPPVPQLPICAEPAVCAVWWTAGRADPDGRCDLSMTMETTGALLVAHSITGVAQGVAAPWVREEAAIIVDSDCSWSLEVRWAPQP